MPNIRVFSLCLIVGLVFASGKMGNSYLSAQTPSPKTHSAEKKAPAPKEPPAAAPAPAPSAEPTPTGSAWKLDESLSAKRKDYFNAFKSGGIDSDRAGLEKFFDEYYFARWTDPNQMGQVQNHAREFLTQDLKDATGNAREYLLKKSFDILGKMVADPSITPTARYNAILTIGSLMQREGTSSIRPVPYAPALPYLLKEYNSKSPEYLRLGAFLGIVRHAQLGIADAEMKNNTIPALFLKTLNEHKPAQGNDPEEQELFDLFRIRAMEGLTGLKSVGPKGEVVAALLDAVGNISETMEFRSYAARALGELNYQEAKTAGLSINYQQIATALIALAKSFSDREIQTIENLRDKEKTKRGGGTAMPGTLGVQDTDPEYSQLGPLQQEEVKDSVRRVKWMLGIIGYTLRGDRLTGAKVESGIVMEIPPEDAVVKKITELCREISQVLKVMNDGPPEDVIKKPPRPMPGTSSEMSPPSSDMGSYSGAAPARPKSPDDKPLKVNLLIIRNELKDFSEKIDMINAGTVKK